MKAALAFLMFCVSLVIADSEIQTDWSGGPGTWQAQSSWGTDFYVDTDVSWSSPGFIELDPLEHTVCESVGLSNPIHIEDIDGDGALDILGGTNTYDEVVWWENVNGIGSSWQEHLVSDQCNELRSVYSDDINGDGFMDILGASYGENELTWWENVDGSGITWQEHIVVSDFSGARFVYAKDVDGDGDVDVFGVASSETELSWWENADGSGTVWIKHVVASSLYGVAVYVEDINGDSFMDIVGVEVGPKKFTWWENVDGTATSWIEHPLPESFSNSPSSVHAKDINGDGFMDIIGSDCAIGNDVFWWENLNGLGTLWTKHHVDDDFSGAKFIRAADVDSDGYVDIFGAANGDAQISLWRNIDGSGTEWVKRCIDDAFNMAGSVCSGDINGDGYLDLAGAQYSGKIAWWDVRHYISVAGLESILLDTQCSSVWGNLEWDAETPAGTAISLQVRSMDSPDTPTAWSDSLWEPCSLEGILDNGTRFVQYRVNLSTLNSEESPIVNDVSITWNPSVIQDPSPGRSYFLGSIENPSTGFATIGFVLEESAPIDFRVFDLTGRIVMEESLVHEAGYGEVIFSDLKPGLYLVHMSSNCLEYSGSFVIIE